MTDQTKPKAGYAHLISGSDIRGVSVDIGNGVTLGPDEAAQAAASFARGLGKAAPRVAVGYDPRISAKSLSAGVWRGLASEGATVVDVGLCTTPAMFEAISALGLDGSIMVTASHLPYERNGLKFITERGGLSAAELRTLVAGMRPVSGGAVEPETVNFLPLYAQTLVDYIRRNTGRQRPLRDTHIVVDAGNGSGGFFAEQVLSTLGATTCGSIFLEPDGRFPGHIPNPEQPEAMDALTRAVLQTGADLGVIFDADCDRAALVDANGRHINRNRLIALLAAAQLRNGNGGVIVTDSVTSLGLTRFIESLGGVHRRFKRGYKNVIDEARRLNEVEGRNCPFAAETSGHCAFRDNHYLDDGMYMVCNTLVSLEDATLEELLDGYEDPVDEKEIRLTLTGADCKADGQAAVEAVRAAIRARPDWKPSEDYEGVRALVRMPEGGEGFILVRLSLHDPVLPINLEADVPGGCRLLARQLLETLRHLPGIDFAPLQQAGQ